MAILCPFRMNTARHFPYIVPQEERLGHGGEEAKLGYTWSLG